MSQVFTSDMNVRAALIIQTQWAVMRANHMYCINLPVDMKVEFTHKGRVAGRAYYADFHVEYNEVLAKENPLEFNNTILHEVAHLVVRKLHPTVRVQPHGAEFKKVFIALGGDGKRCHSYDTSSVRVVKTKTRYECACNCQKHLVTKNIAQKASQRMCKKCKGTLRFTGKVLKIK